MRRPANGFTLIEVMLALVILTSVVLGITSATARFMHSVSIDKIRAQADAIADARIGLVRSWPTYVTLDSAFADTTTGQPYAGWTQMTTITQTGGTGQPLDYKRVTVKVIAPNLPQPVERSVTIAAP